MYSVEIASLPISPGKKPGKATCEWNVTWKYAETQVSLVKDSQKDVSSPSASKKGGLTSVFGGDS